MDLTPEPGYRGGKPASEIGPPSRIPSGAMRRSNLTPGPGKDQERSEEPRPFGELRDSGLLWLINRVVFHPRGFALALTMRDGEPVGWTLLGDGSEVWRFNGDEDDLFEQASKTLNDRAAAESRVIAYHYVDPDGGPELVLDPSDVTIVREEG